MNRDPFAEVEPLEPLGFQEAFASLVRRSIKWDLIGPHKMWQHPEQYGESPASPDVLAKEYAEMVKRKNGLLPISHPLSLFCYIAAESATDAILAGDESLSELSDDDKMRLRMQNVQLSSAVTETVIGHLLQAGLIKYGGAV